MRQEINDNKREDKDLINNTLRTYSELGKLELLYHLLYHYQDVRRLLTIFNIVIEIKFL